MRGTKASKHPNTNKREVEVKVTMEFVRKEGAGGRFCATVPGVRDASGN